MDEVWKPLVGKFAYDLIGGRPVYEVSNRGRVRKCRYQMGGEKCTMLLGQHFNINGQLVVALNRMRDKKPTSATVSKLVAKLFVPNPQDYLFVRHIDGNPENNCADNLEWVPYSESTAEATKKLRGVSKLRRVQQLTLDGVFVAEYESVADAARAVHITQSCISNCCHGRAKKSAGFLWRFVEVC